MSTEKEIWFRKVMWSYFPVSTMGWMFLIGLIFGTFALVSALQGLLSWAGRSDLQDYPILLLIPAVIFSWVIAERHSE